MDKPTVFLLGKLPPPFMGPSIATGILLKSSLNEHFRLIHINTKVSEHLGDMGKWSLSKFTGNLRNYVSHFFILIRHRPDVVVIPISQSTAGFLKDSVYILLAALTGRKTVLHLRGSSFRKWLESTRPAVRSYVRMVLKTTNGVIVLGENLRHLFDGLYPAQRVYSAPNGGNYRFPARKSGADGTVRLLYIGNLQESKGIIDLLDAMRMLPSEERSMAVLTVLGNWRDDKTERTCRDLVATHSLPVHFIGGEKSSDKLELLANADIFVFTPREPEGHPWVIVEAMAAGLPVISTDRGAIIESVKNGENGFIVPLHDPAAISGRLLELINSPEKRKRMGAASRKKYLDDFTEERMVENLTRVFHNIINN